MGILDRLNILLLEDYRIDKQYRDWAIADLEYILNNWSKIDQLNHKIYLNINKGIRYGGLLVSYGDLKVAFCYSNSPKDMSFEGQYSPSENLMKIIIGKTPKDVFIYKDMISMQNSKEKFFGFAFKDIYKILKSNQDIRSTFIHELIHHYDYQRTSLRIGATSRSGGDFVNYINTPVEFNSWFQQLIYLIDEIFENYLDDETKRAVLDINNPDEALDWFYSLASPLTPESKIFTSKIWEKIRLMVRNFNEKYLRKFKKRFYQYLQGKKQDLYGQKKELTYNNAVKSMDSFTDYYFRTDLRPRKRVYLKYQEKYDEMKDLELVLWVREFMKLLYPEFLPGQFADLSNYYKKAFKVFESKFKSIYNSKIRNFKQQIDHAAKITN